MRRADYTWYRQGRPWNSIQYTNTSKHERLIIENITINIVLPSGIHLQIIFRILYVMISFMSRKRDAKNETTKILIRNKYTDSRFVNLLVLLSGTRNFAWE